MMATTSTVPDTSLTVEEMAELLNETEPGPRVRNWRS
jgi:hypothetical protein